MAANKGLINVFKNGLQEAFYPKTIYETVLTADGSSVTLKDEMTALQSFQTTATEKLSGIEEGANNYVHPTSAGNKHIPSGGSAGQILRWSADGTAVWGADKDTTYTVASTTADGLMSSADKTKLDGIAANANNYVHPTGAGNLHIPAGGESGQILRWSAAGTAVWGTEINTTYGPVTGVKDGLMIAADKTKLDGIEAGANNYVHPDSTTVRHVTDAEKADWNAKETTTGSQAKATKALTDAKAYTDTKVAAIVDTAPEALDTLKELATALGDDPNFSTTVMTEIGKKVDKVAGKGLSTNDYTTEEKEKLAGVAANANNYVHPTGAGNNHIPTGGSAGQILRWSAAGTAVWASETNTTYGVVSKTAPGLAPQLPNETTTTKYLRQDGTWVVPPDTTYTLATTTADGLMSTAMVTKLNGIEAGANKYIHPTSAGNKHIPAGGEVGQILKNTAAGTVEWANEITYGVASATDNGLMSSADKTKLDGIAAGANNYVHPSTAGNKHIPSGGAAGQILKYSADGTAVWAAEKSYSVATQSANGLMSSTDKTKLDGVEANANNYVHPDAHDASIITESATKRFVSDTEKATWNAKASTAVATTAANGLMSKTDKSKLDGIAAGANNYVHPTTAGNLHIPAGGSAGQILKWSAAGTAVWGTDKDTTYTAATTTADGLMSSADKTKLDGIAAGANNYVHPDSATVRHVTDAEKATWNAKETTTGAQAKATQALTDAKAYADTKVASIVDTAPEALNTLKELATALGDDPNFSTTVMTEIGKKVDKVTGKGLSTNDYTTAEKNKLAGIAANANKYVHPTGAGNLHIPAGGASGQILRWSAAGTAVWGAENNTTYTVATPSKDGLMSKTDKAAHDTLVTENAALKQILAMFANMNGYSLALTASMAELTAAFTELYTQAANMQFVYGDVTPIA